LDKLQTEFSNLQIRKMEVWYNADNAALMAKVVKAMNSTANGVPLTIVGDQIVIGYYNDAITGQRIRQLVNDASKNGSRDIVGEIMNENSNPVPVPNSTTTSPAVINLPLIGAVNLKTWSIPLLAVILGTVDGFNPCAMWALLFLISLLLGQCDRKKMWILGSTFIITGAVSYFLFMAAWLNLFLVIGYTYYIRWAIGAFAIVCGILYLKKWRDHKKSCEAINEEKRGKLMNKLRAIANHENYFLAIMGIIGLSLAINIVWLICSAGLPAIYTQVLTLAKMPPVSYYLYILLYVFFFCLNQIIIFLVAMFTMEAFAISTKYSKYAYFIGGLIILILGILLIFKPSLIMLG